MQTSEQRRPAVVPATHPDQRYFTESRGLGIKGLADRLQPSVRVFRGAGEDTAEVSVRVIGLGELTTNLAATDLRRLASDLLDAADDIEQHPAAVLSYQAEQDQIAVIADPAPVLTDAPPADAAPALPPARQYDEYHGWVPA